MQSQKLWKVYRYWITLDGLDWSYVGCTSKSLNERASNKNTGSEYIRQCPKFGAAIKKYGWSNFQREILEDDLSEEEAFEREQFYIQKFDSVNHGFNTSTGGRGGGAGTHRSEETRKKISDSKKGHSVSVEVRKKISESLGVSGVLQYDKSGSLIAEYPSIHEAERQSGIAHSSIIRCLKGRRKSAGGYGWQYKTN